MYCIERLDSGGQWIQEICFKTEFKAFVNARTKSRATLKTYRVVHATWNQVVTVVQGSAESFCMALIWCLQCRCDPEDFRSLPGMGDVLSHNQWPRGLWT